MAGTKLLTTATWLNDNASPVLDGSLLSAENSLHKSRSQILSTYDCTIATTGDNRLPSQDEIVPIDNAAITGCGDYYGIITAYCTHGATGAYGIVWINWDSTYTTGFYGARFFTAYNFLVFDLDTGVGIPFTSSATGTVYLTRPTGVRFTSVSNISGYAQFNSTGHGFGADDEVRIIGSSVYSSTVTYKIDTSGVNAYFLKTPPYIFTYVLYLGSSSGGSVHI